MTAPPRLRYPILWPLPGQGAQPDALPDAWQGGGPGPMVRAPACPVTAPAHPVARPVVLDTNIVLDLLVFDDPHVPLLRRLLAQDALRWISNARQRQELYRVLHYAHIAARLDGYGKSVDGVMADFDAGARLQEMAPRIRYTCTDADDQHYLELAAAHRAVLVSKDRAVLKLRKRMAQHYDVIIGSAIVRADGPCAARADAGGTGGGGRDNIAHTPHAV